MSAEATPLLSPQQTTHKTINEPDAPAPAPSMPADVEAFLRSFEAQYMTLLILSAFLLGGAYTLVCLPEVMASRALRLTGALACELGTLSTLGAAVLRARAADVRRTGHAARFVQDICTLRAARTRSEAAVIVKALGWVFAGLIVAFFAVFLGYCDSWDAHGPAKGEAPPLDVVEAFVYQIFLITAGVFATRCVIAVGKIGAPPAPAEEVAEVDQVAAVQEKV